MLYVFRRMDSKLAIGHLPRFFTCCMICMRSEKIEVAKAAATSLKVGSGEELRMSCFLGFISGNMKIYIDGLVQDCSNSSALAMELLQSWLSHRVKPMHHN